MVIIPILCYNFKESWKIQEKNGINSDSIGYNTYLRLWIQGTLEKSRKILNTMKILLVIIPILGYKFKESWRIPEKMELMVISLDIIHI